jgi:dihydrofolate reductase
MSKVRVHIATSLDGYAAGPDQSTDEPLGVGGEALHDWAFVLEAWRRPHGLEGGEVNASSAVMEEVQAGVGAVIMGRRMFGGGDGEWGDWAGWWGDDPPFHAPVFVLTHYERESLPMEGGTTFHFVTGGIESALEQARAAAGDGHVDIAGGANAVQQYLAAGLVDELELHVAPMLLGGGERLFEGLGPELRLEQMRAVDAPGVAHLKYRVVR